MPLLIFQTPRLNSRKTNFLLKLIHKCSLWVCNQIWYTMESLWTIAMVMKRPWSWSWLNSTNTKLPRPIRTPKFQVLHKIHNYKPTPNKYWTNSQNKYWGAAFTVFCICVCVSVFVLVASKLQPELNIYVHCRLKEIPQNCEIFILPWDYTVWPAFDNIWTNIWSR